ncbi:hypothetical protein MesoLj113a_22790 [Mesorhizobium sp. 113-1-2]|nr:hypothetical protein MesoLj113a_22790 [Mesorhizobium sp. 113-1-2]
MRIEIRRGVAGSGGVDHDAARRELPGEGHGDRIERCLRASITHDIGRLAVAGGTRDRAEVAADHDDAGGRRCQQQRQECLGDANRAEDVNVIGGLHIGDILAARRPFVAAVGSERVDIARRDAGIVDQHVEAG